MKLKDIKPNKTNPRTIKDDKFRKLVNSIRDFPKMMELRPMVIDSDGTVLGGNMRLKALQELGYTDVPDTWVKRASELTDEEKQRFIIADNVGFGEWDWDALGSDWDAFDLTEWGIDLPVYEMPTLNDALNELENKDKKQTTTTDVKCPKCGYQWQK